MTTSPLAAFIADTSRSPYARLKPAPLTAVTLTGGFWAARYRLNRETMLLAQHAQLEATGRLANFRRAAGRLDAPFAGRVYNDSDVYKWLEAAAWTLAVTPGGELQSKVDALIADIAAAQRPDGYLNTYYARDREGERWSNLRDHHELYCAGHLFQAAIAHYRATGATALLTVAQRFADLICATFGPGPAQRPGVPGHPEVELALVELYRVTGAARYLAQAEYFLTARGQGLIGGGMYYQDHLPFRQTPRLAGHAVRALYLCSGAADLYAETGEPALGETLARLWGRMTARQMYLTGGLGARHEGEAFGDDYELPNARAYAETCAGIANVMWAWRMLQLNGDAIYADVLEQALYNAVLPGLSLDGLSYFYVNPLQSDGTHRRAPWFECACCPPNLARLLASLPGYVYSLTDDTIWVHLYAANDAFLTLPGGREVRLVQRTRYPWDGNVTLDILSAGEFGLRARVPAWCGTEAVVLLNGEPLDIPAPGGAYVEVRRAWQAGDSLCLRLPLRARWVEAHPYALENAGRVALMRGPLLYCLEGVDHPGVELRDVTLPAEEFAIAETFSPALLGGVATLRFPAASAPPDGGWSGRLYRPVQSGPAPRRPIEALAVPYYAWANRAPGPLQIWLRRS